MPNKFLSVAYFERSRAAIYRWSYERVLPYDSRAGDRMFMKFDVEVMPLGAGDNTCYFNFL